MGVDFNAVPLGHELETFILAIYNIAGPGQAVDSDLLERIKGISKPLDLKIRNISYLHNVSRTSTIL